MSHPETCPVCEGSGKALGYPVEGSGVVEACYGCEGRGWILAHDYYVEELDKLKKRVSTLETELHRVDILASSR